MVSCLRHIVDRIMNATGEFEVSASYIQCVHCVHKGNSVT